MALHQVQFLRRKWEGACPETQYVDNVATLGPFNPNQIIQASKEVIAGNGIDTVYNRCQQ